MVVGAGVHPDAFCVPVPCGTDCVAEEVCSEAPAEERDGQAERGDFDVALGLMLEFVVSGGGTGDTGGPGSEVFVFSVLEPLFLRPGISMCPPPVAAYETVEESIVLELLERAFHYAEVGIGGWFEFEVARVKHLEEECCYCVFHGVANVRVNRWGEPHPTGLWPVASVFEGNCRVCFELDGI